jgi:hypothetical protein
MAVERLLFEFLSEATNASQTHFGEREQIQLDGTANTGSRSTDTLHTLVVVAAKAERYSFPCMFDHRYCFLHPISQWTFIAY